MPIRFRALLLSAAIAAALVAALPSRSAAQGAPPARAGGPPSLANWWHHSSLAITPQPKKTLVHVEGTLSASESSGNQDGKMFHAGSSLIVRRARVTNRFDAQMDKQDMIYGPGGGEVDSADDTIHNIVDFDVTPHSLLLAGIEHYRNTTLFIDRRVTVYAGGGATLFENAQHALNVAGGIGYAYFAFDRDDISRIIGAAVGNLPTLTPSGGGLQVMQTWHTVLPEDKITISEGVTYMDYFNVDLGHTSSFNLSVTIPVAKHVTIGPSLRYRHEDNIYVRALHVKVSDRTVGFNFGVTF